MSRVKDVFSIGKFNPMGHSGLQRDLRTITQLGGKVRTVASFCLSPKQPKEIFRMPIELVSAQMRGVIDEDVGAIKIGSLFGAEIMNAIADFIEEGDGKGIPLILEPVMSSSRNSKLTLDHEAVQAFERRLFFHADLLCPNLTEAFRLTGVPVTDLDSMRHVAEMLMTLGNKAVLLTGGSLGGEVIYDVFLSDDHEEIFEGPRYGGKAEEGTGDALTAAIAFGVASGKNLTQAVCDARAYVQEILRQNLALTET